MFMSKRAGGGRMRLTNPLTRDGRLKARGRDAEDAAADGRSYACVQTSVGGRSDARKKSLSSGQTHSDAMPAELSSGFLGRIFLPGLITPFHARRKQLSHREKNFPDGDRPFPEDDRLCSIALTKMPLFVKQLLPGNTPGPGWRRSLSASENGPS